MKSMSNANDFERRLIAEGGGEALVEKLVRDAHAALGPKLELIRRPQAALGVIATPLARLLVAIGPRGVLMVHYMDQGGIERAIQALRYKFDPVEDSGAVRVVQRELSDFLAGDLDALRSQIDLSLVQSPFRLAALRRLQEVPAGSVMTYQALAAAIGAPSAQRAVGSAMATNPIPVYVPCHRVVRSDGSVGWYGGGPSRKIMLLRVEGFSIDRHRRLGSDAVWGHRQTRIFCRPQCSAARRADRSKLVIFAAPEQASHAGMRPCKLCHPG